MPTGEAPWVQEAELEDGCGYHIQIAGQKGSGKGRTGRPNWKQEETCLPLHKAAVDAHRRSRLLPAAILQAGVRIPGEEGKDTFLKEETLVSKAGIRRTRL